MLWAKRHGAEHQVASQRKGTLSQDLSGEISVMRGCWGRSSRRPENKLTAELEAGDLRLPTPTLSLECVLFLSFLLLGML